MSELDDALCRQKILLLCLAPLAVIPITLNPISSKCSTPSYTIGNSVPDDNKLVSKCVIGNTNVVNIPRTIRVGRYVATGVGMGYYALKLEHYVLKNSTIMLLRNAQYSQNYSTNLCSL